MRGQRSSIRIGHPTRLAVSAGLLLFALPLACSGSHRSGTVREEMDSVYIPASRLFGMVWDPSGFERSEQQREARELVNALAKNFHNVSNASDLRRRDPIISTTLDVTRRLLGDTSKDLENGRAEIAQWKLRRLVHSCVSCHSRTVPSRDFVGAMPVEEPKNFDSGLNVVEFLIASRQFDRAAGILERLAQTAVSDPGHAGRLVPVLRLWLLLEIRTLDRPAEAAERLTELAKSPHIAFAERQLLQHWVEVLKVPVPASDTVSAVDRAETLLVPIRKNVEITADDWHLVTTVQGSKILHQLIESHQLPEGANARANFLLALSYQHMNIAAFEGLRDVFLERCIRAFPGTPEAREAYRLYEWNIRQASTGSGGLHLDESDRRVLEELSKIAGVSR